MIEHQQVVLGDLFRLPSQIEWIKTRFPKLAGTQETWMFKISNSSTLTGFPGTNGLIECKSFQFDSNGNVTTKIYKIDNNILSLQQTLKGTWSGESGELILKNTSTNPLENTLVVKDFYEYSDGSFNQDGQLFDGKSICFDKIYTIGGVKLEYCLGGYNKSYLFGDVNNFPDYKSYPYILK